MAAVHPGHSYREPNREEEEQDNEPLEQQVCQPNLYMEMYKYKTVVLTTTLVKYGQLLH
jgi:hypothetical protein